MISEAVCACAVERAKLIPWAGELHPTGVWFLAPKVMSSLSGMLC